MHPELVSGLPRSEVPEIASDAVIQRHLATFYAVTRAAVERWGGAVALSSLLETAMSGVNDRLNRREVKGALQRAFVDYLAIATTHPGAAELVMFGLADLLGFEHPKRKRSKTEHEKFEALVKSLRKCGPLGEAAIKRAAEDLGADPVEFEP
jgi:hypothetical protein